MSSWTFEDVCPLLLNNNEIYTQHVRVGTDLQLTTFNLTSTVSQRIYVKYILYLLYVKEPVFFYECLIGGIRIAATRNNESSVTCHVDNNQVLKIHIINKVTL